MLCEIYKSHQKYDRFFNAFGLIFNHQIENRTENYGGKNISKIHNRAIIDQHKILLQSIIKKKRRKFTLPSFLFGAEGGT